MLGGHVRCSRRYCRDSQTVGVNVCAGAIIVIVIELASVIIQVIPLHRVHGATVRAPP